MVIFKVGLDTLLKAKHAGNGQKLELELEAPVIEPPIFQSTPMLYIIHVASRYSVSLQGLLYEDIEKICKHVRSLGCNEVMIQVEDPNAMEQNTPSSIDFLGVDPNCEKYEFWDYMEDHEKTMVVRTDSMTMYDEKSGPCNDAINPLDLFQKGIIGYSIGASITDRLDGRADGVLILNSKNRRFASEVHHEVLSVLEDVYRRNDHVKKASTVALMQVLQNSKHKNLLNFHNYQS
jgi:hypothetical protein